MITSRGSGLLLHVSSLPSRFGIGDLGPAAEEFVTALSRAGQAFWQVLPLHPTLGFHQHSPYHATSLFALNPLFISPERMVEGGIITRRDLGRLPSLQSSSVDFMGAVPAKMRFLRDTARRNRNGRGDGEFERFCSSNQAWLDDYALSSVLARLHGPDWAAWPPSLRDHDPAALSEQRCIHADRIGEEAYLQYLAFSQWSSLRAHAGEQGVRIIGDLPFFPAYESADVWAHRDLFRLKADGRPLVVAGVPPDAFTSTGQLWGNPVFSWEELERQAFSWWVDRVVHLLGVCDLLRLDHFRGLAACWEIPSGAATAADGRWVPAPGSALLSRLAPLFSDLPLIAEDLGTVTPDVTALREAFGIPGTRVLQFGFDGDPKNPHAPSAISEDAVLYTGTHDNTTLRGWFGEAAGPEEKERIASALGRMPTPGTVSRELVALALASPANIVIIPAQDLLGLPGSARMNQPGTREGNWRWRLCPGQPGGPDWEWLHDRTALAGRDGAFPSRGDPGGSALPVRRSR